MKKYIVNDIAYLEHELVQKAQLELEHAPEWERHHWLVVLDWLQNPEFIEAHTSGSTGTPKLCRHSGRAVRASAMITAEYFDLKEGSLVLLCLPSTFIAGKMMILRSLIHGWQLTWVEPSSMPFGQVKKHYDFTAITPHQCQEAFNVGYDFKLFKHILLGGSSILPQTREKILLCRSKFHLGYAMTETLTHIAMQSIGLSAAIDVFKCLGRVTVSTDEQMRLIINAPHLDNPKVETNDIAELIDNKCFRIIGRWDHMINSGGIKIYPEILEQKVGHMITRPFFFKGESDKTLGQQVVLMIEGDPFNESDFQELTRQLNEVLSPYERPKNILFIKEFRRTENQKIIKR